MDDYKKIPFDDPDLCVPDLDDFDQMKEFFLDCAAEYFRYLSSDDMEKMLAALGKRIDVLATPTDAEYSPRISRRNRASSLLWCSTI